MESRPQDNPYSDPFHLYSAKPSADGQHVPQTVDYLQLHSDLPFDLSHEDIQNVLGNFDPPNPTQAGGCSEAAGCSAQSSETVTSLTGSKEIMLVLTDIKEGILELQAQFGNMKSELSSVQSHCAAFASEISEIRNLTQTLSRETQDYIERHRAWSLLLKRVVESRMKDNSGDTASDSHYE